VLCTPRLLRKVYHQFGSYFYTCPNSLEETRHPPPELLMFRNFLAMLTQAITPLMPSAGDRAATRRETLYFAYGSNLCLKQMAKRCEQSLYIGRGILRGYTWQINTRGYANVVMSSPKHHVEGIVYLLYQPDEEQLDRNEGVCKRAYDKAYLTVEVFWAPDPLFRRQTTYIVEAGGPAALIDDGLRRMANKAWNKEEAMANQKVEFEGKVVDNVLVYACGLHVQDGQAKEEYVDRIYAGISDAIVLGLETSYLLDICRRYLPPDDGEVKLRLESGTRDPTQQIALGAAQGQPARFTRVRRRGDPEERGLSTAGVELRGI
jgi:gamma-glutamylcyclotransferase